MHVDAAWLVVSAVVGALAGSFIVRCALSGRLRQAADSEQEIESLKRGLEAARKEALLEAKEEAHRLRAEVEEEARQEREQLQKREARLSSREENLDRRASSLERREQQVARRESEVEVRLQAAEELHQQRIHVLEESSNLSSDEARELLLRAVEEECRQEMADLMRRLEERAKEEAERKARHYVALALQRCAVDQATESSVSVVPLPNDEMKGRIIGREGRNIRAFEGLTGVDLIIDDTPECVVVSCFDPVRREVARTALSVLVNDGRIHPARIEEVVDRAREEIDQRIKEEGERAEYETRVGSLPRPIAEMVGRLAFRTSYGQNCLDHSIEVSRLAGMLAEELGADALVCRRAGLLHDIGKAADHELEGTHLEIGIEALRRCRESTAVVHAVECHHGDVEPTTLEAIIVQCADAISASRPGARREMLETYIKRLEKLEEIAQSFTGVDKCFAVHAGREIRIIVQPDDIDDLASIKMSRDIAKRIEDEMQYPGEIRVTVIRETRAVATAH